jgi:hypothetical protein
VSYFYLPSTSTRSTSSTFIPIQRDPCAGTKNSSETSCYTKSAYSTSNPPTPTNKTSNSTSKAPSLIKGCLTTPSSTPAFHFRKPNNVYISGSKRTLLQTSISEENLPVRTRFLAQPYSRPTTPEQMLPVRNRSKVFDPRLLPKDHQKGESYSTYNPFATLSIYIWWLGSLSRENERHKKSDHDVEEIDEENEILEFLAGSPDLELVHCVMILDLERDFSDCFVSFGASRLFGSFLLR